MFVSIYKPVLFFCLGLLPLSVSADVGRHFDASDQSDLSYQNSQDSVTVRSPKGNRYEDDVEMIWYKGRMEQVKTKQKKHPQSEVAMVWRNGRMEQVNLGKKGIKNGVKMVWLNGRMEQVKVEEGNPSEEFGEEPLVAGEQCDCEIDPGESFTQFEHDGRAHDCLCEEEDAASDRGLASEE